MGTKIIKFCDACEADENQTPPFVDNTETYTVQVSGYATKTMDLCQHHFDTLLGNVVKAMTEIGHEPRLDRERSTTTDRVECPTCGNFYGSRLRMTQHHRRIHNFTAPDTTRFGNPTKPMACPECGKVYQGPTGLGSHRYHAHGIPGRNTKANEETK